MGIKKYNTEEERKAARREANKRWREKHPEYALQWYYKDIEKNRERCKKNQKKYYSNNIEKLREKSKERMKEYHSTKNGRAHCLVNSYKTADKEYNRGECTLTPEWIVEHIFSQPCAHCGETDWHKLGCNRLDNSLPHTPDNVEPCCLECNIKLGWDEKKKTVYQYTLDGEFVREWESTVECGKNGFNQRKVSECCRGGGKHKGYIWRYKEEVA